MTCLPVLRDIPKGDARRHFLVLLAIDQLGDRATTHFIAQQLDCFRSEIERAVAAMPEQYGVVLQLQDVGGRKVYSISEWGVLKRNSLSRLLLSRRSFGKSESKALAKVG